MYNTLKISNLTIMLFISTLCFSQNLNRKVEGKLWGFVNDSNEVVIEFQYEAASDFFDGVAAVQKGGKWGLISPNNDIITPFQYDAIQSFPKSNVRKVYLNGKWALVNLQGKQLTDFDFDYVGSNYKGKFVFRKKEKFGLLDKSGKIIIKPKYEKLIYSGSEMVQAKKRGKWGYLNEKGEKVIPFRYDEIDKFYGSRTKAKRKGKWGIIDNKGKKILDFKFDFIGEYRYNTYLEDLYAPYVYNTRVGLISSWGAAVPFEYNEISEETLRISNDLIRIRFGKYFGAVNNEGNVVIPVLYTNAFTFSEGLAVVKLEEKYGYIDEKGTVVIDFNFDRATQFKNGTAEVFQNQQKGVLQKDGTVKFDIGN